MELGSPAGVISSCFHWEPGGEKDNQVEAEILNGMALYRQGSHYVCGAGASYVYTLFRQKKHRLVLSAGLRFTIQPAYRNFSSIYSYLDLPLRIRWQFG